MIDKDPAKHLPGLTDWLVTLCEFVSIFAISSSFFKPVEGDDDSQRRDQQDLAEEWFMREYFEYWALSIIAASVTIVIVPIVVSHCFSWDWNFLRHPRFPGTIQIVKLGGAAGNVWYLMTQHNYYTDSDVFELKDREKLVSAGIIAFCEAVSMLNTFLVGCCGKSIRTTSRGMKNNPVPRESKTWIFFNLWKDFGITKELYFLLVEFPFPLLLCGALGHWKIESQSARFHLLRALLVAWSVTTLFLSAKIHDRPFHLVGEKVVPLSLVVREVVLAFCEIWNDRINRAIEAELEKQQHRMSVLEAPEQTPAHTPGLYAPGVYVSM